jgi:predicted ATP-grasp superfamily ATP-dependent carboligase
MPASTSQTGSRRRANRHADVGAVVVGSDYRALAVVRSLGRRGVSVWVLTGGDDRLAAASRYAVRRLPLRGADDEERCSFLMDMADREGLKDWVLFPTSDEAAMLIGRHHRRLRSVYALTSPPWRTLRWAHDKLLTYRLAASLGMSYPRTWTPTSALEVDDLDVPFPAIIKPSVKEQFNPLTAAKAWRVDSREQLRDRFVEAARLADPRTLMIQELIPRRGAEQLSYAALCDSGRPLASVSARRVRQYPAEFGRASTYVETIVAPDVEELATRFLEAARFDGLVEVEFMRDPRDGCLKLLDVNPRVWGWHGLCAGAGVDFPHLAYLHAQSHPVPATRAKAGVRWLRLSTDLPTSLREVVRGNLRAGPYLRTLCSSHESATFARDDPRPALVELPMLAGTLIRRVRHGDTS